MARVRTQFGEAGASRQCSYFALLAAASAVELLDLARIKTRRPSDSRAGAAFTAAYEAILTRASAAKAASPDEAFIETIFSPRPLSIAQATLRVPSPLRYTDGPAAHSASGPVCQPAAAAWIGGLALDEFVRTETNAGAPNIYDDIMGGTGGPAAADYWADKRVRLGLRAEPWSALLASLRSLDVTASAAAPDASAAPVAIIHRLVMAFTVIAAGGGRFLVLDSHSAEAGWMGMQGLERYVAYHDENCPGGGGYMLVTWATGMARDMGDRERRL